MCKSVTNPPRTAIVLFFTLILALSVGAEESDNRFRLDNGLDVILKENHNSALVAAMVFVKSGARYESEYENGLTHFLEHLLLKMYDPP